MRGEQTCPRCGAPTRPPGAWSSRWICALHGEVYPVAPVATPSAQLIRQLGERSAIPLWMPWPLPRGWVVGAAVHSGDDVAGIQATGVVASGPNPLGGAGDLLVVGEEQGVGLGAGLAGLTGPDPGSAVEGEPHASVSIEGRVVPLWWVDAHPNRAVYVGQWDARWLWVVMHPASAGALLLEDLALVDLRDLGHEIDLLPYGTPPPWLRPGYDR